MAAALTLIFETSTPHASLATVRDDGHIEERRFTSDRSHNAVLFSPLTELLSDRKAELVIIGSGPGSYSGTRVGIAAAQGVAIASGCPAVAVPSILAVPSAANGQRCLAIGDARRGSYWTADVADLQMLTGPTLTDAAGLAELVQSALASGVTVFSFEEPMKFPLTPEISSQVKLEFPTATLLWRAYESADPKSRSQWAEEIPQPLYLKPPHITPAKRSWLVTSPQSAPDGHQ